MDRESGLGAYLVVFGVTLVVFRGWWVRERIDYSKRIARSAMRERTRQRAEETARWYEINRGEGERRFAYFGVIAVVVGVAIVALKWF